MSGAGRIAPPERVRESGAGAKQERPAPYVPAVSVRRSLDRGRDSGGLNCGIQLRIEGNSAERTEADALREAEKPWPRRTGKHADRCLALRTANAVVQVHDGAEEARHWQEHEIREPVGLLARGEE